MKISMEFIDSKGFVHFKTGKSKTLVKKWLNSLIDGTCIYWRSKNDVFVSQQYVPKT